MLDTNKNNADLQEMGIDAAENAAMDLNCEGPEDKDPNEMTPEEYLSWVGDDELPF